MKNRKHICIFAILVLWFLNCLAILQAHEYRLIYHEEFNKSEFVETRHLQLPKNWYLQNTKKWGNNVITKKREDGFFVHSPYQKIDLHGEKFEVFGENLRVEIVIRNMDTDKSQADVEIGICDYGLLNPGYHVLIQTKLSSNEEKTLSFDSSVFQNYCSIQPVISVHGSVIIKSLKFFTQKADDVRILEGTILERSALLNPKKSDYPDCRFTAHFKGYSLLQGDNLHRDIQIITEGFRNYKLLKTDLLKKGDLIQCAVIPFDKLPHDKTATQQSDELSLYDLDSYYVLAVKKIDCFNGKQNQFSDQTHSHVSIFERHINPPVKPEFAVLQQQQIAKDLQKINRLLEGYPQNIAKLNEQFQTSWEKEKQKDSNKTPGYNRIKNIVWRNMNNSFWQLPEKYTFIPQEYPLMTAKSLQAQIAFKKCLEANGIQFMVSIVPDHYSMAARVISQEFRNVPDYQSAVIAKQLLEAGIETVYIADDIIKNYHQFEYAYFYPDNDHPSDTVQNIISDELAKRIARYHLPKNLDASKIEYKRLTGIKNSVLSSQYPANCDIGSNTAGSAVQNRAVFYNGYLLPSKTDGKKNSPIFVFGNSYIETPMLYPDSLPTLLASKILLTVDSDRIGSILPVSSTIQKIFHNPEFYLRNRVVVILQMGAKHFYAQWSDISQMDQNLTGK